MIVLYFFIIIASLGFWLCFRNNNTSKLKSTIYTVVLFALLSGANWYLMGRNEAFNKTSEISSKNYSNILSRYNLLKGSVDGERLREQISDAINDGFISPFEYKKIMGSEIEVHFVSDAHEKKYIESKQKILNTSVFHR